VPQVSSTRTDDTWMLGVVIPRFAKECTTLGA
jgi:hypothetical protein